MVIKTEYGTLHISEGNDKLGPIYNIALPPITTCNCEAVKFCGIKCYARKGRHNYPGARKAREDNAELYYSNPAAYFESIQKAVKLQRYFRWHEAGDIPDRRYLEGIIDTAKKCKGTQFMAFTKQHDIVNKALDDGLKIPRNLKIIFSGWPGFEMHNPYRFPEAHVTLKGLEHNIKRIQCKGRCCECLGCWQLRKGQQVEFDEH